MSTVTCSTCKHYQLEFINWVTRAPQFAKCGRTKRVETTYDPVTGKNQTKTDINYCSTERGDYSFSDRCGPEGIHWFPRKKEGLFTLMKKEAA